jgi:hypothetical protein
VNFPTLADDAKPYAEHVAQSFRARGFSVLEQLPNISIHPPPTFFARRRHNLVVCEIATKIDLQRLWPYRSFAKSRPSDTRVEVRLLPKAKIDSPSCRTLEQWGFGLHKFDANYQSAEILPALDQTLNPDLPPLEQFAAKHRALMGTAYDDFDRGRWVQGFEAACSAFEQLTRDYLWKAVQKRRVTFVRANGRTYTLTKPEIDRQTLGQVRVHFDEIMTKTAADLEIAATIKAVNPARIEAAHRKGTRKADRIVRRSVEDNMWSILAAMRHLT